MSEDIVGLIPMAGKASRLGKLPFSKELYPIEFDQNKTPKVVSSFLIESMIEAGIKNYHLVLRSGKWDIPSYFGSGSELDVNFCYHIAKYGYGVPFTLNQAYPFFKNKTVVFGFPDILIKPKNAFNRILEKLVEKKNISIALGLFPTSRSEKSDMVSFNDFNEILEIKIKSSHTKDLKYAWVIAAWKPEFTTFLKNFIVNKLATKSNAELENKEYYMGDVIISAIKSGMKVQGVIFNEGRFIDIGTPEDLSISSSFFN